MLHQVAPVGILRIGQFDGLLPQDPAVAAIEAKQLAPQIPGRSHFLRTRPVPGIAGQEEAVSSEDRTG